jgi:hypothetical protein
VKIEQDGPSASVSPPDLFSAVSRSSKLPLEQDARPSKAKAGMQRFGHAILSIKRTFKV